MQSTVNCLLSPGPEREATLRFHVAPQEAAQGCASGQERDCSTFDGCCPELTGGGESLTEKMPGSFGVARLSAGEEHAGPFQPCPG